MQKILKKSMILFISVTLLLAPFGTAGLAQDEPGEEGPKPISVAADVVIARPIGLAAMIVGSVLFIIALPFAAISGNVGEVGEKLVAAPARYTFKRPVGHFQPGTKLTEPLHATEKTGDTKE